MFGNTGQHRTILLQDSNNGGKLRQAHRQHCQATLAQHTQSRTLAQQGRHLRANLRAPAWRATSRASPQKNQALHSSTCAPTCASQPGAPLRAPVHRRNGHKTTALARQLAHHRTARKTTRQTTEATARQPRAHATPRAAQTHAHQGGPLCPRLGARTCASAHNSSATPKRQTRTTTRH